jgi:hypothetical protein
MNAIAVMITFMVRVFMCDSYAALSVAVSVADPFTSSGKNYYIGCNE